MYTPQQFTDGMRKFGDPTFSEFTGWPTTNSDAAASWARLISEATLNVIPAVLPPAHAAATVTLTSQLALFFTAGTGIQGIPAALQVYAASLAVGMLPTFAAIAPVVPLDLSPLLAIQHTNPTAERAMKILGLLVMNWFRTGTATNLSSGATVTWI